MQIFIHQTQQAQPKFNINFGNKKQTLAVLEKNVSDSVCLTKSQLKKMERNKNIIEMFLSGLTSSKIAKILGITDQTVRNVLKSKNLEHNLFELRENKIVELLNNGEMVEQVAKLQEVSVDTVMRIASKHKIKPLTEFKVKVAKRNALIKELILQGLTLKEIAIRLGLKEDLVKNLTHKLGNPAKQYRAERLERIINKLKEGVPITQVADDENISVPYVRKLLGMSGKSDIIPKQKKEVVSIYTIRNQRILEKIQNGLTVEQISKEENVSAWVIKTIAKENKVNVFSDAQKARNDRNDQILALLLAGVPRKEIAQNFNVGVGVVNQIAEANTSFKIVQAEKVKRASEKLKEGLSLAEVADQEKVFGTTILRRSEKRVRQRKPEVVNKRNLSIAEDLKNGMSIEEAAKKYDLSPKTINNIRKRLVLSSEYRVMPISKLFTPKEIKEQSRNITELQQKYRKFKLGDRSLDALENIEVTIEKLSAKIQEFKSRLKKD